MKKICIIQSIFIVILLIFGWLYYKNSSDNINILKHNIEASKDTVKITRLENKKLLYEKLAYISKGNDLDSQLNISKSEISELKNKLKNINNITKIESQILFDTIYIKTNIENNNIYSFNYDDPWLKFKGISAPDSTKIYNISIPTNFIVGLSDNYNIFIKTDNPYMNINNITGSILDKKLFKSKNYWTNGITIGLGIQYGIFNKKFDVGPQISYGFTYHF